MYMCVELPQDIAEAVDPGGGEEGGAASGAGHSDVEAVAAPLAAPPHVRVLIPWSIRCAPAGFLGREYQCQCQSIC